MEKEEYEARDYFMHGDTRLFMQRVEAMKIGT